MIEALLLLASPLGAPVAADPLAPARAGKIQCIAPNLATKKCMAIGRYTVRDDGSYDAIVTVMIAPTPLVTMETRTSGKVENGRVCGIVRREDYANATFKMDGGEVNAAMQEAIKGQVVGAVAAMEGKNGCTSERTEGDVIVGEVTLDGKPAPELTQRYIWVGADDGYTIGQ